MSQSMLWKRIGRLVRDLLRAGADTGRSAPPTGFSPGQSGQHATRDLAAGEIARLRFEYDPERDGDPDPGEVVWTWVPYEEHDGRGKDRPVLILARLGADTVAGCFLSTKQHRGYVAVGTGGWDPQGRPSYLAPDRVLGVAREGMRREGHELDRERFIIAAQAVARTHGLRG